MFNLFAWFRSRDKPKNLFTGGMKFYLRPHKLGKPGEQSHGYADVNGLCLCPHPVRG